MSTIKKNANAANVVFGLSGFSFNGSIIQSYSKEVGSEKSAVQDNSGETAAVTFYDQKSKVSVEGVVNGSPSQVPGDIVTINGDDCIVDQFTTSGENNGWRKVRLEATKYSSALT